jgi:FHA domain
MNSRFPALAGRRHLDTSIASRLSTVTSETGRLGGGRDHACAPAVPELSLVAEVHDRNGQPIAYLACDEEIGDVLIGRGGDAVIRLHDDRVSRRHATIRWDPGSGTHLLADHGSANGTYLNRRRISGPVSLLDGALIHVGSSELRYRRRCA